MTKKSILIVDDSKTDFLYAKKILKKSGFDILHCELGEQALDVALEVQPAVILMDIVMPDMDGFRVTRLLAGNVDTSQIPVIILSSKSNEIDKAWAKRQGAKGYFVKPADPKMLTAAVKKYS